MIMKGGDRNTVQIRTKLYEIWDRTGPQQDSERNIVNQDRNRFCHPPVSIPGSRSVPVPYNLVLICTVP